MEDGTFLQLDGELVKIQAKAGYWVAFEELTSLSDVQNGELVGVWTDTKTGKVFLDRVKHFSELTTALFIAKQFNQLAIWDNRNAQEIRVN